MTQSLLHQETRVPTLGTQAPTAGTQHAKLVKQTQKWVAQTFYGELLKQVRNSPFHSDLFDGGRGGQAFGTMLDQQFADRMARSSGSKLVNSIVRRIEARSAYAKQESAVRGKSDPDNQPREEPGARNQGRFKDVKIHVAPALRA